MKDQDVFKLFLLDGKIEEGSEFDCANARNEFISSLKSSNYLDLTEPWKGSISFDLLVKAENLGLIMLRFPDVSIFLEDGQRPENGLNLKEQEDYFESRRIIDQIFEKI